MTHRALVLRLRPLRAAAALAPLALVLVTASGCLEEPEIEDRYTRLDVASANVRPGQELRAGVSESLSVTTEITYRRIVTGYAVAELRASSTIAGGAVTIHPDAPRELMAADIDRVLAGSVSLGRAIKAVTGWDHLIQPITFTFRAVPQSTLDSAGVSIGATSGLFLVCYLGSGERIERVGQADSIAITPFPSAAMELLPVGMELAIGP